MEIKQIPKRLNEEKYPLIEIRYRYSENSANL